MCRAGAHHGDCRPATCVKLGGYNYNTAKVAPPGVFDLEALTVLDVNCGQVVPGRWFLEGCVGFILFWDCQPWEGEKIAIRSLNPKRRNGNQLVLGGCAHKAAVGDSERVVTVPAARSINIDAVQVAPRLSCSDKRMCRDPSALGLQSNGHMSRSSNCFHRADGRAKWLWHIRLICFMSLFTFPPPNAFCFYEQTSVTTSAQLQDCSKDTVV